MKNTFNLIFLFFALFSCVFVNAQVFYPKDSSYINTLSHENKTNFQNYTYSKIDTSINNFQNYFNRNTNGNCGLASVPLFFNYQTQNIGFNFQKSVYENDIIDKKNVNYYQTKGPYANLTGISGSKQEQVFKFLFSNTFKNKLNITLGFNRYSSLGFYRKQQSFTNNFYTSSNYKSKNNRIGYYTFFLFNKLKHQENGGIKNDTVFKENININKQLLGINLNSAKREVRYTSFNFNPWFRLNKKEDSTSLFSHYINYELEYNGNYSKYFADNIMADKFYNVMYLDTVNTRDSSHWRNVSNELKYVLKIIPMNSKLQIGLKNEYNQVHQFSDSAFQNTSLNAGFYMNNQNYNGFIKANYIINGSNATDYLLESNNSFLHKLSTRKKTISFKTYVNFAIEKRHADYNYNSWFSNHYIWKNKFIPTEKVQSTIGFSSIDNRFGAGVVFQNIKNQLYFNELVMPTQTPIIIQNAALFIYKDFLLFKHLGFNAKYTFQSSSYQSITSLPTHIANSALYYQGNLFKNALQLQVGFNANYFSEFNGMAYSPALNIYYTQTRNTVGNYPYIDFFLTARIKPVRIFIKIDHVSQGLLGSNYSLVPNYIQNDRAFKFGLNWLFFD